jgi:IS30 family transposase
MRSIGRGRPLSAAERARVVEVLLGGGGAIAAGAAVGCSSRSAYRVWDEWLVRGRRAAHSGLRLSLAEREQISRGLAAGKTLRQIGRELGRAASTISREVAANGGRQRYRALRAERRAIGCAGRPKRGKLSACPRLRATVQERLDERWSPQQVSARLRAEFPDDLEMRISHETIYQSLFVQSRGELRRQLTGELRSGRVKRRPRGAQLGQRGRIRDMVLICERPAEISDRAVPGHWEGDLLVGKQGKSYVATLVERHTRYVLLARLGNQRTTEHVVDALITRIGQLPDHLVRSLTWDQGNELAAHKRLADTTGMQIYFCDPHSPWQRGSNENTNGLLRQYLPKGSDLAAHSQADLDAIAAQLNGRPRKTLDWKTPAEKMQELLR